MLRQHHPGCERRSEGILITKESQTIKTTVNVMTQSESDSAQRKESESDRCQHSVVSLLSLSLNSRSVIVHPRCRELFTAVLYSARLLSADSL